MAQRPDAADEGGLTLTRGGPLDLVRFLAAFLLVIHHFAKAAPVPLDQLHPVFERGYLATDFFLIVSGYVLTRIYGQRVAQGGMSVAAFWTRRATRVVPAHLIMVTAFVAMVLGSALIGIRPQHPEWYEWRELPAQLLLVQSFIPGGKGWNAPSWSLSALLVCYALFPLIWPRLSRIRSGAVLLIAAVATYAAADLTYKAVLGHPVVQMPMWFGAFRAIPLFLLGVGMGVFNERTPLNRTPAILLGLAGLIGLVLSQLPHARHDNLGIACIAAVVMAAGAIHPRRPSPLLEKMAVIAFALFITNEFVRNVWFGVIRVVSVRYDLGVGLQWGLWLGALGVAVVFAVAFHYGVDMPTQRWIRRRMGSGGSRKGVPDIAPSSDPVAA